MSRLRSITYGAISIVSSAAGAICTRNCPEYLKAIRVYFGWKNHISKHRSPSVLIISIEPGSLLVVLKMFVRSMILWRNRAGWHRLSASPLALTLCLWYMYIYSWQHTDHRILEDFFYPVQTWSNICLANAKKWFKHLVDWYVRRHFDGPYLIEIMKSSRPTHTYKTRPHTYTCKHMYLYKYIHIYDIQVENTEHVQN